MSDNVKLSYMAPGASEYQFEYNPYIDIWFEHLKESHVLSSGLTRSYHKGYKLWARLAWQSPLFFRGEQYDRLRHVFNLHAGLTLHPAPESAPGASYGVQWANAFDFHLVAGATPYGYEGTMLLEGTSVLSELDPDVVLGTG